MESLDQIWEELHSHNAAEMIIPLDSPIMLPNPYSNEEYSLTHYFQQSTNAFIGKDLGNNQFHIKILPCSSFDHVKIIHHNLKLLRQNSQALKLVEIKDIFEYKEEGYWMVIIVNELLDGYSLDEFTNLIAQHEIQSSLSKDTCIWVFLTILDIIEEADKVGILLGSLLPDSIIIYKNPDEKNNPYGVKISVTSKHPLFCGKSKLEHLYPPQAKRNLIDGEIWGAGISLYTLIGVKKLNEIPPLRELDEEARSGQLPIKFNDPALEHILKRTFKDSNAQSIFTHSFVKVWKGLFNNDPSLIEPISFNELHVLNSGLLFDSELARSLSIKKILEIGIENSSQTCQYLNKYEILNHFLKLCISFDWSNHLNLLDSLFLISGNKLSSQTFKEFLTEIGFLSLMPLTMAQEVNQYTISKFVENFIGNNTLTMLQIIKDCRMADKILTKATWRRENPKHEEDEKFIRSTMPFYGPNSIEIIESAYNILGMNEIATIEALHEVPFYFKLENCEALIKMLHGVVKRGLKNQKNQENITYMLKEVVLILGEILILPSLLQNHHVKGACISHDKEKYFSYLGKNPLLLECLECGGSYCTICYLICHKNHRRRFLHYNQPHFRCSCTQEHEGNNIDPAQFILPVYRQQFSFELSDGTTQTTNNFKSDGHLEIKTAEPIANNWNELHRGVVAYFEVKILKAGSNEDITIELKGSGFAYHSLTGVITKDSIEISKGPRFGSYDTVGMGLTSHHKLFVTFNGLIVHPLLDFDSIVEIRPLVVINGTGYEIEIKLRNWMFCSAENVGQEGYSNELFKLCEPTLEMLCKQINRLKKKNSDSGTVTLHEMFREVLETLKRPALLKKLKK
ncbi:unnamed protein product [Blepharisma stoltei]|uniref:Uncharacterized protein n=1 Tax=Blepharisma stoltei TaxID=1481888 RepID=A0AAU9IF29_9CILI|nr:unnamed protein product [Blepharisma stoltei]